MDVEGVGEVEGYGWDGVRDYTCFIKNIWCFILTSFRPNEVFYTPIGDEGPKKSPLT